MSKRTYSEKPRVYLDLDGVIADFEKGAVNAKLTTKEFKAVKHAYLNLVPIKFSKKYIKLLFNKINDNGMELFVLSKIPKENPHSATDKILWLNKHFPYLGENVILSPDKGCIGKSSDILVDDHPEWANAKNFKGNIIHFTKNKVWLDIFNEIDVLLKDNFKIQQPPPKSKNS